MSHTLLLVLHQLWQYETTLKGSKLLKDISTDKYGNFVAKQKCSEQFLAKVVLGSRFARSRPRVRNCGLSLRQL